MITSRTHLSQIKRSDDDLQIVYGEVYAPNRLDTQGEMMTAEDIEVMAHRFMSLQLNQTIDRKHDNIAVAARPVESFIARQGDPDYTPGAWVLGVKIDDAETWQQVKTGELNGFSFQAMVSMKTATVEIETVRDHVGETEPADDGHTHFFFAQVNDMGQLVAGVTSKADDGHYHVLARRSVTQKTDGHSHRFFIQ